MYDPDLPSALDPYSQPYVNPYTTPLAAGSFASPITVGNGATVPPPHAAAQPIANGQLAPVPAPAPQSGAYSGNLQELWTRYRQEHPTFHPTQGAAMSLQPFVEWARSQGANLSIASPSSGGFVKGITDPTGQFIKLLDGSDNPTWLPGGDAPSGGGGGSFTLNGSLTAPFTEQFQPSAGTQLPAYHAPAAFNYPDFVAPTPDTVTSDPYYSFSLGQGLQAIKNTAASQGNLLTGGTFKGLQDYAQNYARGALSDVFNRKATEYTMNRGNAADAYAQNYKTQYTDPYSLNTERSNTLYGRDWQDFLNRQSDYFTNQNNAFDKYYKTASLGAGANA